jgi:hypothetical protein
MNFAVIFGIVNSSCVRGCGAQEKFNTMLAKFTDGRAPSYIVPSTRMNASEISRNRVILGLYLHRDVA